MADFDSNVGQHDTHKYSATSPHPLHGKDPNIINELGHTNYPKFVHKFHEKGHIVKLGNNWNDPHDSVIVNNEDEEIEKKAEGYFTTHIEAKAAKKQWSAPKQSVTKPEK